MGMRINVAIGWGMPMDDLRRLCRTPGVFDGSRLDYEALEAALSDTGGMTMPGWPFPITGPNDDCVDLLALVGYDDWSDVVLFPSIGEARTWRRRDDDIDYALLRGPTSSEPPENRVEYVDVGFHPYDRLVMNADGSEAEPLGGRFAKTKGNAPPIPGVPVTLRHWVTTTGLLDQEGVARLRPLRAVWWS